MEDALFPLDFDLTEELLLEGCLLEDPGCSEFLDSDFTPLLEINNTSLNPNSSQETDQDDIEISVFPANRPVETQKENIVGTQSIFTNPTETAECSGQLECYLAAEVNSDDFETVDTTHELNGKRWIEPRANPGSVSSVGERLTLALRYMKESMEDDQILIQIWVPIKKGDRYVLSTCGQPYWLNDNCQRLVNYRTVSTNYQFSAEEDSNEVAAGLPGRVFMGKLPLWTPDVRNFSSKEYLRVDHAQHYEVCGTVALPVFEQGSQRCLGVVEVMKTTQIIDFRPELENICTALQAVNLRSSEVMSTPNVKVNYDSYQDVVMEILEIMRTASETHRLPLAQTWIPCIQQGKKDNRHSDENYMDCVSTLDAACYASDPRIRGFHKACSNHHLFRGQGVVGKAFTTNKPCFSTDVTAFNQSEYPLSHYARMFGLRAAIAIRLRSIQNVFSDYVLEFFLPVDCIEIEEQKEMLGSMSFTIQLVCRSLRVVTDKELEDETILWARGVVPSKGLLNKSIANEDEKPNIENMPKVESSVEGSSLMIAGEVWAEQKGKSKVIPTSLPVFPKQEIETFGVGTHWDNLHEVIHAGIIFPEFKQHNQDSAEYSVDHVDSFGNHSLSQASNVKKKRTNVEKSVSLQVLQQHFAESLKDAATSIGVCPTTLKRICRQHGISRWPSRTIKKVDHSLRKLQLVIDSVKGAERTFQINHLDYATFPEVRTADLTSPNLSGSSTFSQVRQRDNPKSSYMHPSFCNSSNSSLGFSVRPPQRSRASVMNNKSAEQKPAYREAEMCAMNFAKSKPPVRSNCPKSRKSNRVARDSSTLGVKAMYAEELGVRAMYGEEQVRFILEPSWGFQDLRQEIAKQFNIENASTLDLKYLDDDLDWVLLTCDADLQECTDIHKLCATPTIKLMVHRILPRNESHHFSCNNANA